MRIGIDARVLSNEKPTGIGICLIQTLKHIAEIDHENDYILFSNENILDKYLFSENFSPVVIPGKSSSLWVIRELTHELPQYKLDVFWGPLHLLPRRNSNVRKVVTINDIALMINPKWGNIKNAILQNTIVKRTIYHSDHIITISNSTKHDLIQKFRISEDKITVIYPGADFSYENEGGTFQIDESLAKSKYLLFIGTIEPRKNIRNIIKAFNLIKEEYSDYKLVLAGKLGWKYGEILKEIEGSPYKEDILRLGYISDEEKKYLLENARLLLFPTYYEGFGIPVVEAMSYGLPVVVANNSSMPEVAGKYAYYVEYPYDDMGICSTVKEVLKIPEDRLLETAEAEKEYIKKFSWKPFAEGIFKLLTESSL